MLHLKDAFGGTAWIVGKGPSLRHLRREHFGAGPVLAINEAIYVVQALGLSLLRNPLYAMNKDGCRQHGEHACPLENPRADVTVILQTPGFSEHCFPTHEKKILIDPVSELGFREPTVMSVRMCAALARKIGCQHIKFLCFDALTDGDGRIYDGAQVRSSGSSGHYSAVKPNLFADLGTFPYTFITPKG